MKQYIIVEADTNDGDYIDCRTLITDAELELIKPVIKCLKDRLAKLNEDRHVNWNEYSHNWETSEYCGEKSPERLYVDTELLTEYQVEIFNEYVPYGEHGVHTVTRIDIIKVQEEINLL